MSSLRESLGHWTGTAYLCGELMIEKSERYNFHHVLLKELRHL